MPMLGKEFSYGLRRLQQRPGFTLIALLILGLGIGANTAIFSLLDAIALRPLPYPHPERLVQIWSTAPEQGIDQVEVSYTKFRRLRESRQLAAVTVYYEDSFNLTESGSPETLDGARISRDFFDVWGVEPVLGRRILPTEDAKGGADVVLLSQGLWQRRFARDPQIVGKTLHLEGRPYQIIGVMPEVLRFPFRDVQIWLPRPQEISLIPEAGVEAGSSYLQAVARLKPGVSLEAGRAEIEQIARSYNQDFAGNADATFALKAVPLNQELVGDARSMLFLLLGGVGLILVIACADVASLLLAQGMARQRELAIRISVGASGGQLVRQMLVEGVLLSLLGGAVGLVLAEGGLRLLIALQPGNLPRLDQAGLDARALAFALGVSLLTGIVFSLAPAFQTLKTEAGSELRGSLQKVGARRRGRAQATLVVVEVAMALTLLIAASLFLASFRRLTSVDLGFNPERLLTMKIALPPAKYPEIDQQKVFFQELLDRVRGLPGVSAAALTDYLPVEGSARSMFYVDGHPPAKPEEQPVAWRMVVSPGYFRTLEAHLVRGHDFAEGTPSDAPLTIVINESLARQYFPNQDPVGQRLVLRDTPTEIIGVVKDIHQLGLDVQAEPQFFLPSRQMPRPLPFMQLLVRTALPPEGVMQAVRDTVRSIDSEQPVADLRSMEGIIAGTLAARRLTVQLLSGFSAVALVLCLLGLYGVLAHSVSTRGHEISVRMALGARPGQVLSLVMRQGLQWVVFGIVLGLATALALAKVLERFLFEVNAREPTFFIAAPVLLAAVALLASWVPARRAARIAPARALKDE
jgi:putative ABC transport system permease protein